MNPSKLSPSELNRHAAKLERDGYTIIPNVLSAGDLDEARRAIDETLEAEAETARKYGLQNENLLMCYNAQGKNPHFPGMLTRHPEPLLVARRVLGEDMFAHNLAIRKPLPTGKKDWTKLGGYLHADWHHFTVNPFIGGRHYPLAVQSVWCISEFTRQNGATYVWPRSHLSLEVPPEQPQTLPALRQAVRAGFGKNPSLVREGGSIGAVSLMERTWKVPILFFGLSLPEHGYHAPNENFDWGQASGGIRAFVDYFSRVAAL